MTGSDRISSETMLSIGPATGLGNIPVRVDNDQRPDVNARYNMGGWPTTALLTPGADLMAAT